MPGKKWYARWAVGLTLVGTGWLAQFGGCGGGYGYSDDCVGADGYNWCIPGGGWDEIHTPSVEPWDFTEP
jgi:hypothetical protein